MKPLIEIVRYTNMVKVGRRNRRTVIIIGNSGRRLVTSSYSKYIATGSTQPSTRRVTANCTNKEMFKIGRTLDVP